MKKRIMSLLLTLALLAGMLPTAILPVAGATETKTVNVTISLQKENTFALEPQKVSVSSDLAENYGYTDTVEDEVSALDVLVRAHELLFGDAFTAADKDDYLSVNDGGTISKAMGEETYAFSFAVDGGYPYDPDSVYGAYGYTGYTVNQAAVEDGGSADFFFYQDSMYMDMYTWFEQDGARINEITVQAGQTAQVDLTGFMFMFGSYTKDDLIAMGSQYYGPIEDAQLTLRDADTGNYVDLSGVMTDEDGKAEVSFDEAGTYCLSAYSDADETYQYIVSPYLVVHVEKPVQLESLIVHTNSASTDEAALSSAILAGTNDASIPVFQPEQKEYALGNVLTDAKTQLRFRYTVAAPGSEVKLSWGEEESKVLTAAGGTDAAGSGWANCLVPGKNTVTLTVTPPADSGYTAAEYTISVGCTPTLSALSAKENGSALNLTPTFSSSVYAYDTVVRAGATSLAVAATPKNDAYTVDVDGTDGAAVDISGKDSVTVTVTAGSGENAVSAAYKLTLSKVAETAITFAVTPADAVLKLYDATGAELAPDAGTTKYSGLLSGQEYTYNASKNGYITAHGTITAGSDTEKTLTLAAAPTSTLPSYTGDWVNFRGNDENMGITSSKTPRSASEAVQKWAQKYGSGWSAAPTPPIIVNDDVYVVSDGKLMRIDKKTGEKLAESEKLAGTSTFSLNPPTYGGGLIYVLGTNGRIQALRADTLKSVWLSEPLGGQTNTPVTYRDGYVYSGTWNSETKVGTYFCLSVTDEDPAAEDETKYCTWKINHTGGFYWAGAYATDSYVVFGSDDGTSEGDSSANGVLYSADPKTGAILDTISGIKGDIRSAVAYDAQTDAVYCTTKGGLLLRVHVNADGTFDKSTYKTFDLGGASTGTPLVYNGVLFIGVSGASAFGGGGHAFKVIDAETMTAITSVETKGYVQTSSLLSAGYESTGKVYVYYTYNQSPGGIDVLEYDMAAKTGTTSSLFTPETAQQQYCICSLVCDAEGTIYYKNDSGYLMAVMRQTAGQSSEKAITAFSSGETAALIDETAHTITLTLPAGSEVKSIAPTIAVSDKAVVSPASGVAQDFSSPVVYTVTAQDGSTQTYTATVKVAAPMATVTVGVYDYTAKTYGSGKASATGVVKQTSVQVPSGTTALEAFKTAMDKTGVAYVETSSVYGAYLSSVGGLAEQDCGEQSGWMFSKNGSFGNSGISAETVSDGDTLELHYSVTGWGADVGSYWESGPTVSSFKLAGTVGTITADGHAGTEADPYLIAVTLPSGASKTGLTAAVETSLHPQYRVLTPDVTAAQDYSSDLTFKLSTVGGAYNTYYKVQVSVASSGGGGGSSKDTIETTLTDGMTQKGSHLTFDVFARNGSGSKIASTVTLNGSKVAATWDDTEKTSYTLTFTKSGANTVTIKAGGATKTYTIQYVPAEQGDVIGHATVDVEAFTIGAGYLIDPVTVELREGENAAQLLDRVLKQYNYTYDHTGTLTSGFYLSALYGGRLPVKTVAVPEVLKTALDKDGIKLDNEDIYDGGLGEFNYSTLAGWMYCVNNVFPNVGFADYYLSDGDVMRVQFTLSLGSDIGGGNAVGGSGKQFYSVADKDAITKYIADKGVSGAAAAVQAAQKLNATAAELSAAMNGTSGGTSGGSSGGSSSGNPTSVTETIKPTVTVSDGKASATVTPSAVKNAIDAAKKDNADSITVQVETNQTVSSAGVTIGRNDLAAVADAGKDLVVNTPAGSVTLPEKAAQSAASQGKDGTNIVVSVTQNDPKKSPVQGAAAEVEVTVTAGGNKINSFSNNNITVLVPVGSDYRAGDRYQVVVTAPDGAQQTVTGTVITQDGKPYVQVQANTAGTYTVTEKVTQYTFTDVSSDAWYYDAVQYAAAHGLMIGVSSARFAPEDTLTRAEVVTVLYRMEGTPAVGAATFTDVPSGCWYSDPIAWAAKVKIVTGYDAAFFGPEDAVTREQLAAILYRYANWKGYQFSASAITATGFADYDMVEAYARTPMNWAVAAGLIAGTGENLLSPQGTATRAQLATLLQRFETADKA